MRKLCVTFYLFIITFSLSLLCAAETVRRSEDGQLSEVVLSFHHVGPGVKLMFLAARAFLIRGAISPSPLVTFSRTNSLFPEVAAAVLLSPECTVPSAHLHARSLEATVVEMSAPCLACLIGIIILSFVTVALSPYKMYGDLKTFRLRLC